MTPRVHVCREGVWPVPCDDRCPERDRRLRSPSRTPSRTPGPKPTGTPDLSAIRERARWLRDRDPAAARALVEQALRRSA